MKKLIHKYKIIIIIKKKMSVPFLRNSNYFENVSITCASIVPQVFIFSFVSPLLVFEIVDLV